MSGFRRAFKSTVNETQTALDKEGSNLNLYCIAAGRKGKRLVHEEVDDIPVDLRSISKVVTSLTVGGLADDVTELRLDSLVAPTLRRHGVRCEWEGVTVRHLLSNTVGHASGYLFRKDLVDVPDDALLNYAVSRRLDYMPGTHFSSSNVGPFLASVLVEFVTGRTLHDWAQQLILEPMGIATSWKQYGGFTAGCTGLYMRCSELLSLAELLRMNGKLPSGRVIATEEWVTLMRSPLTRTPSMYDAVRVFPKWAYGLGLWVCENGNYYCDGTDGQYLIVVPSKEMTIATTGQQPDMKPITRCMLPLLS